MGIQDALAHITFLRRTVVEEVTFGLEQREMQRRVHAVLTALQLDHLAERVPTKLSGGQSKRLAVATGMMLEPDVLILDDSFAGLDADSAEALARELTGYSGAVIVLGNWVQNLPREVVTLIDRSLIPGRPEPTKVALPELVGDGSGEVVELATVVGSRGGRAARWWRFGGEKAPEFIVGPVDLSLQRGEVLWLRGANDSGKTTLLRAIAGLDEPDVGFDESARAEFHAMLAEVLRAGRAVIMTCHDPRFMGRWENTG